VCANNVFGTYKRRPCGRRKRRRRFCSGQHGQGGAANEYHGRKQTFGGNDFAGAGDQRRSRFENTPVGVDPAPRRTRFSMVRFGNVLGSSGSVVPLFRQQIKEGGPVTVTDLEVTRYFMTIPEAAQLVVQAGAMAEGGDVFVLDMGEPVKIIDLAYRMIELSGLLVKDESKPAGDIEIKVTGCVPGRKIVV